MRTLDVIQGTPEWHMARAGKITASESKNVMDFSVRTKTENEKRANYKRRIIGERLTGNPIWEGYETDAMKWGTENEPRARAEYELRTGNDVDRAGFVLHPTMDFFGASPDGLIGKHGGCEYKCPNTTTHIKWMTAGVVPEEHRWQMHSVMVCCELDWLDFCSYDPRLPENLRLFVKRLDRDEAKIAELEAGVIQFNDEVEEVIAALNAQYPATKKPVVTDDLGITDEELKYIGG